jgi:hypothetical protein
VVDLVSHQARNGVLEDGDSALAIDLLVFDRESSRPGNHPAHVEEAPATLVLLVSFGRLLSRSDAKFPDLNKF